VKHPSDLEEIIQQHLALLFGQITAVERSVDPVLGFQLFRVGDAVMGRNVHAAMFDSARLLKDL